MLLPEAEPMAANDRRTLLQCFLHWEQSAPDMTQAVIWE